MANLKRLRAMSSDFVRCQAWRKHPFEDFIPLDPPKSRWGIVVHFRCPRCTTERHDTYDSLGNLSKRRYIHPPGYKWAKDERPTPQQFKLEAIARLREESDKRAATRRKRAASRGRGKARAGRPPLRAVAG